MISVKLQDSMSCNMAVKRERQVMQIEKTRGKKKNFVWNAALQLAQWEHLGYVNPVHEIYIFYFYCLLSLEESAK